MRTKAAAGKPRTIDLYPLLRNYDVWGETVGINWNAIGSRKAWLHVFYVFSKRVRCLSSFFRFPRSV